jgi:hypothetical protein
MAEALSAVRRGVGEGDDDQVRVVVRFTATKVFVYTDS